MQVVTSKTRTNDCGAADPFAATVQPGEVFTVESTSFTEGYTHETIHILDTSTAVAPLTGPIRVEGAEPGMVLRVDILKLEIARDFGVMLLLPGKGAFAEHVVEPVVKGIRLDKTHAHFNDSLKIPLSPMLGKVSVAPAGEPILSNRPGPYGGNMDNTHICEGASVYLPIFVEGAYLALGDAHAAMGDGESCVSGVECEMRSIVRCALLRDLDITHPIVVSRGKTMTTAEGQTLEEACKKALHSMAVLLAKRHDMGYLDAARLISIAGDVHTCQIVNPLVGVKVLVPYWLLPLP